MPTLLSALMLTGCSSFVKVDHFGGQEAVDNAYINPDIPILIGDFGTLNANSAGGVDVQIQAINTSPKTIKYITYWLTAYNRVGDYAPDKISGKSTQRLDYTGPLEPGFSNAQKTLTGQSATPTFWKNVWYNKGIVCATIDEVEVTYMDNTKVKIRDTAPLMTRPEKCRHFRYN